MIYFESYLSAVSLSERKTELLNPMCSLPVFKSIIFTILIIIIIAIFTTIVIYIIMMIMIIVINSLPAIFPKYSITRSNFSDIGISGWKEIVLWSKDVFKYLNLALSKCSSSYCYSHDHGNLGHQYHVDHVDDHNCHDQTHFDNSGPHNNLGHHGHA